MLHKRCESDVGIWYFLIENSDWVLLIGFDWTLVCMPEYLPCKGVSSASCETWSWDVEYSPCQLLLALPLWAIWVSRHVFYVFLCFCLISIGIYLCNLYLLVWTIGLVNFCLELTRILAVLWNLVFLLFVQMWIIWIVIWPNAVWMQRVSVFWK